MNEKWMCIDPASRVRALLASAVTSGAFLSGALMAAAPATAACTAAEPNCTAPSDAPTSAVPTQRELNEANVNYLLARGELVRLQGVEEQARRDRDEASKAYGEDMNDPRYAEKHRAWNDAQLALKQAGEKEAAASKVYVELDKRATDAAAKAAADAAAAQRAEEDRVAAKWGGPTRAELEDANARVQAATKEVDRLQAIWQETHQKFETALALFTAKKGPYYAAEGKADDVACAAYQDARNRLEAARKAARALEQRATDAVKRREAQEETDYGHVANWGGVTQAQFEEANNRTLALRDELARLQAIVDKAQGEAWTARQAYGLKDPRYLEKQRIFDEAIRATIPVSHQEWDSGNFYESLVKRNEAALARQAEDAQARAQEARNIYGPPAEEVEEAKARMQAAQNEAAPLQVSADKANQELTDAQEAYGPNDLRTKEKARAFDDARQKLGSANQKELKARQNYESLVAKVNKAAKRRAAREEAERQAAQDVAAADPDAAKKQAEAAKQAAERDRLSKNAAKAWIELKQASEMYGPSSPQHQAKLKAYEAASKLVEPFAEKNDPEPTKDQTTPAPTTSQPATSGNADQKKDSADATKATPAETKPAETKPAESKPDATKPAESTESKPAESKPAESQPADSKTTG